MSVTLRPPKKDAEALRVLRELKTHQAWLAVENDRLRPMGEPLTSELREIVINNREVILEFLLSARAFVTPRKYQDLTEWVANLPKTKRGRYTPPASLRWVYLFLPTGLAASRDGEFWLKREEWRDVFTWITDEIER